MFTLIKNFLFDKYTVHIYNKITGMIIGLQTYSIGFQELYNYVFNKKYHKRKQFVC